MFESFQYHPEIGLKTDLTLEEIKQYNLMAKSARYEIKKVSGKNYSQGSYAKKHGD